MQGDAVHPRRSSGWCWLGAVCVGVVVLVVVWLYRAPALGLHWMLAAHGLADTASPRVGEGAGVAAYCVDIQAHPVQGLQNNLSGLTFNAETQTLFAIINRPAAVAELSLDGVLMRHMPLSGVADPEGITHVAGQWFVVADEASNQVYWLEIGPGERRAAVHPQPLLPVQLGGIGNLGLEGVSWDQDRGVLVVVQENLPQRVWVLEGLQPPDGPLPSSAIRAREWAPDGWLARVTADQSSITVRSDSGRWLMLSAASALVVEYTPDGALVGLMPLWRGQHGLQQKVPQAEGIATDDSGRLFVVSEPNLFYRFKAQALCG